MSAASMRGTGRMGDPAKPHICLGFRTRKWWCTSTRPDGVVVAGSGYSPEQAYGKWRRNYANPLNNDGVWRRPTRKALARIDALINNGRK